jgi:hypothetical protein
MMIPAGQMIFPYVSDALNGLEFTAIEAVVSATLGFGIHAAFSDRSLLLRAALRGLAGGSARVRRRSASGLRRAPGCRP